MDAIEKISTAREARAVLRKEYAKKAMACLSLTLNIAGYPKFNEASAEAMKLLVEDLKIYIRSREIAVKFKNEQLLKDQAGDLFICGVEFPENDFARLKKICLEFEQTCSIGRLTDVDVYDLKAMPISSGIAKNCLVCGYKPAIECSREGNHHINDVRNTAFNMLSKFLNDRKIQQIKYLIAECANKAIQYEFLLSPKPGLVDYFDEGAHNDMNYYTFINSTAALSPYWIRFGNVAFDYYGKLDEILPRLRQIGLEAEGAMYRSTNNINTQKGLIFIYGLSIFATALSFRDSLKIDFDDIKEKLKSISKGLVEKEVKNKSENSTHGATTYRKFGLKGAGVRFEAENAFPVVFESIIPFFEENEKILTGNNKKDLNEVLSKALLKIISVLNDSNVLYRSGSEVAEKLKNLAADVLSNKNELSSLTDFCKKENISPGGSADMLALSLFFFYLKKELS